MFNAYRAVAHTFQGDEHLLYVGATVEQVRKSFAVSFHEVLTPDEQTNVNKIFLERWSGKPDAGFWKFHENLRVPRVLKGVQ